METCGLVSLEAALTPLVEVSSGTNSSTSKVMPGVAIQEILIVLDGPWKPRGRWATRLKASRDETKSTEKFTGNKQLIQQNASIEES